MKNNNNNNNSNNNNYNALFFHPVATYLDSDLQEKNILKDNKEKTGIHR